MSIFLPLYLKMTRSRFRRQFNPVGDAGKHAYLVSMPNEAAGLVRALPFVSALIKTGSVVLLVPGNLKDLFSIIRVKKYEIIFYDKRPTVFSDDYRRLRERLAERKFDFLIELSTPPNTSLPHLCDIERRVTFFDTDILPYYNILIKHGYASLKQFLGIGDECTREIFHFPSRDLRSVEKKLDKARPLLFMNAHDPVGWEGGRIVLGTDVMPDDPVVWKMLYLADAYCGARDVFYEFAVINGKKIINGNG